MEYYGDLKEELREKERKYAHLRVIALGRNGEYHSSYCFNRGILESRGELLVIADGDVVVESECLLRIWEEHQGCEKLVMYIHRYNEPKHAQRAEVSLEHLRAVCRRTNPWNYGGCLTVRKHWLMQINGYEQHEVFGTGFHANGYDIASRLRNLGMHIMWHPSLKLYHPYHGYSFHPSWTYKVQGVVIEHRQRSLSYLPFSGIRNERNVEMPVAVRSEVEGLTRRLKRERGMFGRVRAFLRKQIRQRQA